MVSRKFNREEWVTKVICLGLRWMRCLGGDVGPRVGLPGSCKGREGAVISSLGLDQAYPGHRTSVTRGNRVLWLWLPVWSGLWRVLCRGKDEAGLTHWGA